MKSATIKRTAAFALAMMLSASACIGAFTSPAAASSKPVVISVSSTSVSKPKAPSPTASVSYPSKSKATVKVSWSKVSGASGYQAAASTSSKFTVDDVSKTTTGKSASFSFSRSKSSYTVYYRVRSYKTSGGKKVYGNWSSVKSIRIKAK